MRSAFKRRAIDSLSYLFRGRAIKGVATRETFQTIDALIEHHFHDHSEADHPCRETLSIALGMLAQRPASIVETGSSAWGTNSSLLFDSYVNSFGGEFATVDLRAEPMFTLRSKCSRRSSLHCDDSVSFLKRHLSGGRVPQLVYLDSCDVDWGAPLQSMIYGLYEFLIIYPALNRGSILLIDDTPRSADVMQKVQPKWIGEFQNFMSVYGIAPGKGALVKIFLEKNGIGAKIMHEYQLLWQF